MHNNKSLLIIPCSKRKNNGIKERLTAFDLYDGPFYRTIRKYIRECGEFPNLDIEILSAKYGLISSEEYISYYDQKMTLNRASELSVPVAEALAKQINENNYREIFINLGKLYLLAFDKCSVMLSTQNVVYAHGMIGQRIQQLKIWLSDISNRNE